MPNKRSDVMQTKERALRPPKAAIDALRTDLESSKWTPDVVDYIVRSAENHDELVFSLTEAMYCLEANCDCGECGPCEATARYRKLIAKAKGKKVA